jgi:hypothetical protein
MPSFFSNPKRDYEWFTIPPGLLITPVVDHLFHDEGEDLQISYRHVILWGHMKRGGTPVIGLFLDTEAFSMLEHGLILVKDGPWVQQLETYSTSP